MSGVRTYHYKRYIYQPGSPVVANTMSITSDEVRKRKHSGSREAFLELLNSWNESAALASEAARYVFVAEPGWTEPFVYDRD